MRQMSLKQLTTLLHGSPLHSSAIVSGYSVDTRTLQPGQVYFALEGAQVDGHHFVEEAIRRGAAAAVVSHAYAVRDLKLPLIRVDKPLFALQELARLILAQSRSTVVAITGSVGKTTTKNLTASLLAARYKVSASPGNQNSQVGLPLSILNHTTGEEDILVLEMGMTASGQIERLVTIAPPVVALLTAVDYVHAMNFTSLEAIALAKAEVFSHPQTKVGFIPLDVPYYAAVAKSGSCSKKTFAIDRRDADYSLEEGGDGCMVDVEGVSTFIGPCTLPGRHNRHNLLGAIAIARYFEVEWEAIRETMQTLRLPERRLEYIERQGIKFLNDSYNACELSVKAALETLHSPSKNGRRIAVLGSMLELGDWTEECHRRVGQHALMHVDLLYTIGEECQSLCEAWQAAGRKAEYFVDRASLVAQLRQDLRPGDSVLIKGSSAWQLWNILDEL